MSATLRPILSETEIAARIREVARDIDETYAGQDLLVVGLLEDSFVFLSDLIRAVKHPIACTFVKADIHKEDGRSRIVYSSDFTSKGKHVLLVGGVLDTGVTLDYIERHFADDAASVRTAFLIDKPDFRKMEAKADFVGFTRSEKMIVGYGLGADNRYRNLPYLAVCEGDAN